MPTSVNVTNLKINELTEAQYDSAVQGGVIGANELSILTDADVGGLPDQTGQSGKFLTTDGTDASWGTISALQNTATGIEGLTISGTASADNYATNVGALSSASAAGASIGWGAESTNYGVACGAKAKATGSASVSIGYESKASANYTVSLGCGGTQATGFSSTALGAGAKATASRAIQIGDGTNSDANTFKVANVNGNFEIMSADGTIPTARLTKVNSTITLTSAGWSSNTQTVTVNGVTSSSIVWVSPAPADTANYVSAGIICSAQGTDSLTFTCTTTPSAAIDVVVVAM